MQQRISFSKNELQILLLQGYQLGKLVGQGATSDIFDVEKITEGGKHLKHVIKVELEESQIESPTAQKNLSSRENFTLSELINNHIVHPHIDNNLGYFKIGDKHILVKKKRKESLSDKIYRDGKMSIDSFLKVSTSMIDSISTLHNKFGYLHRDIKPSNYLLDEHDNIYLSDFQNAIQIKNINRKIIPTRGATAYTSPRLLNKLVNGEKTSCSEETDLYSLGATFFYMITGEHFFNVGFKKGENEQKYVFKNQEFNGINENEYRTHLHSQLKKIPEKIKPILLELLDYTSEENIDLKSLQQKLQTIDNSNYSIANFKSKIYPIAALISFSILGLKGVDLASKPPSIQELLTENQISKYSTSFEKSKPHLVFFQDNPGQLESHYKKNVLHDELMIEADKIGLEKKLVSAWSISLSLNRNKISQIIDKDTLSNPFFVPSKYISKVDPHLSYTKNYTNNPRVLESAYIPSALEYLKSGIDSTPNIEEILVSYIANSVELKIYNQNQEVPSNIKEYINNALAIYHITREDGTLDFQKLESLDLNYERSQLALVQAYIR